MNAATDRTELIYRNPGNTRLLELLPAAAGRLLDCGCGAGDNARLLAASGWLVSAITLDSGELDAAKSYCVDAQIANLEFGLPQSLAVSYDVILMSHVVEHIADPRPLLSDARKRLVEGGVIAVALPNILHYRQRLSFLRGAFDYTETGPLDRTHLRFYTYRTGRALLEENGFEIIRAVPDGGLPWMRLRRIVPARVRERIDRFALRSWPDLVAHQSLFLARSSS